MARIPALDVLRGCAVLWMTVFHLCFDLNHFGFIHQDFYRSPVWTVQRTCILSLFLLCAGAGQALAVHGGQSWGRFWRRWLQVAGCALLVSVGSALMFPQSWIYFGVLHGMAVMLVVCRATARWGRWLWLAGVLAVAAGCWSAELHALLPGAAWLDGKTGNWLGLISHKPVTEDYVPVLPWLGVMWWGMAMAQAVVAQAVVAKGWAAQLPPAAAGLTAPLGWIGRWSLSWYMLHQPILIGALLVVARVG